MNIINGLVAAAEAIGEMIDSANTIYLTTTQPSYVGGDVVQGTVELNCVVPFNARAIILKVQGYEKVWWQERTEQWEGEGENRKLVTKIHEHSGRYHFFKQVITLNQVRGRVEPGRYTFPFSYTLPQNLPGTYYEEGGSRTFGDAYSARVIYKFKATVDVAFRHDLHYTSRLVVNEKFDALVRPTFGEAKKSFFATEGELHSKVVLNKNAYFPGETIIAKLKANNTSKKSTTKVFIKVNHELEMHANGHRRHVHKQLYRETYPGFAPFYYGVRYLPFQIPMQIQPSSSLGRHIKSTYTITIECDIPGAINLSVTRPLTILAPQFLWSTVPPLPAMAVLPPEVCYRPQWQPDNAAPNCTKCNAPFGLFNRRHHCRNCMKIFCKKCCSKKSTITKTKILYPVPVCDECYPIAQAGGQKFQTQKMFRAASGVGGMLPPAPAMMQPQPQPPQPQPPQPQPPQPQPQMQPQFQPMVQQQPMLPPPTVTMAATMTTPTTATVYTDAAGGIPPMMGMATAATFNMAAGATADPFAVNNNKPGNVNVGMGMGMGMNMSVNMTVTGDFDQNQF